MRKYHFVEGFKRTIPFFIGVIPFGLAFGIYSKTYGMDLFKTVLMSAIVFSGAAQFIAVELMYQKACILSILASTLLINLRHFLMSLSLKPFLSSYSNYTKSAIAFGIVDESYGLSSIYFNEQKKGRITFLLSSSLLMYFGWVGGSYIGYILAGQINDPLKWGLDFAMPATFIGLLIPQIKSKALIYAVIVSAAMSVISKLIMGNHIYILIGAISGALVGYSVEKRSFKSG